MKEYNDIKQQFVEWKKFIFDYLIIYLKDNLHLFEIY